MTKVLRNRLLSGAAIVTFALTCSAAVTTAALTVVNKPASARLTAARADLAQLPRPQPEQSDLTGAVDLVNTTRASFGLPPVTVNAKLQSAAQAHSNDQAARNLMTHTGSDGSNTGTRLDRVGFAWTAIGECVAAGQTTVPAVVNAWMTSQDGHREILLGNYKYIGLAVARSASGVPYWTYVAANGA